MQRRQFIETAMAVAAAGVLGGCVSGARRGGAMSAASESKPTDAAAWIAARRFASTSFGNIAYVDRGSGEAALFLHGFPLNSFQWRGAFDRLSKHRRCVAPDFMGLGYTQVADQQSVAPSAQVAMLAAVLDSLSISAVDLVANDSGGAVAQLFVLRYPKRARTLLLTNCDVEPDSASCAAAGPRHGACRNVRRHMACSVGYGQSACTVGKGAGRADIHLSQQSNR